MTTEHLNTRDYWQQHYESGGTSGRGSQGEFAEWKADVVNQVVRHCDVTTVLDVGCGDGQQAALIDVPRYLGIDVSQAAVQIAQSRNRHDRSKRFDLWHEGEPFPAGMYDMVMSLEVLMHILEERMFTETLSGIFASAREVVVLQVPLVPMVNYGPGMHDKHRAILPYLAEHLGPFSLTQIVMHPSASPRERARAGIGEMASDFLVFRRADGMGIG